MEMWDMWMKLFSILAEEEWLIGHWVIAVFISIIPLCVVSLIGIKVYEWLHKPSRTYTKKR